MNRWFALVYGVVCHVLFLITFAWLGAFVAGIEVLNSIDSPTDASPATAIAIDLGLLLVFAAQHSIMARPAFKRVWTRIVPKPIERSTYVLASCLVTALVIWQWRGIPIVIWDAQSPALRFALWGLFAAGWLLVPAVSLLINHFDLFGTRQTWLYFQAREYSSLPFRTPLAYAVVRHPLYVAWGIAFWAIPAMTAGHLLFALGMSVYMGLAAIVEERDLMAHFGRQYVEYRRRVPMFIPRWRPSRKVSPVAVSAPAAALSNVRS